MKSKMLGRFGWRGQQDHWFEGRNKKSEKNVEKRRWNEEAREELADEYFEGSEDRGER